LPKAKKTCRSDVKRVCPEQGMLAPTVARNSIAGMASSHNTPGLITALGHCKSDVEGTATIDGQDLAGHIGGIERQVSHC
jgi:hypothetical protein